MRQRLSAAGRDKDVCSAGLVAAVGECADEMAQTVALEHGIDLSEHRSQPVDQALMRWADLVLVMEQSHRRHLLSLAPTASGKVFLLGHWSGTEIPDPYLQGRDVFEDVYEQIAEGVSAWSSRI